MICQMCLYNCFIRRLYHLQATPANNDVSKQR
jgi:hypothetical protein